MITGFLTRNREPALSLDVRGPDGAQSVEAIIDTGFNGALTLPPKQINALGLPPAGQEPVTMADGREITTSLSDAYVIIDETAFEITVAEAPTPLIGTDLLWGFSLYVEFQAGGAVELVPLAEASG